MTYIKIIRRPGHIIRGLRIRHFYLSDNEVIINSPSAGPVCRPKPGASNLFLPKLREESVIEEVSPGRPVVTGFTDAEVLIFDSVLVEGFRVIEESTQGLLRIVVTGAENTEVREEIERLQTYEYRVASAH